MLCNSWLTSLIGAEANFCHFTCTFAHWYRIRDIVNDSSTCRRPLHGDASGINLTSDLLLLMRQFCVTVRILPMQQPE